MFKKLTGTVVVNGAIGLMVGLMLVAAIFSIGLKNSTIPAGAEKVYLVLIQGNLNYDVDQGNDKSNLFTLGQDILSKEQYFEIRSRNGEVAVRSRNGLFTIHPDLIKFTSGNNFIVPRSLMSNFPQVDDSSSLDLIAIKRKQGTSRP